MIELKYTSEVPKTSGWYWARNDKVWGEPEIVWLQAVDGDVLLSYMSGVIDLSKPQQGTWMFCPVVPPGGTVVEKPDCAVVIEPTGEFYGIAPRHFVDDDKEATRGESLFTVVLCMLSDENFVEHRLAELEREMLKPAS